jgi:peptidyl-tRNA hydrolase
VSTAPEEPQIEQPDPFASTQPWAMQLAMRDERANRPTHLAVCEAAASAVVTLLADPRSAPEGEWYPFVHHWASGPIRKVVRRGRGIRFTQVQELDGVEVEHAGAQVRAFVPGPVDQVPAALAKMQVGGTDVPEHGKPSEPVDGGITVALTALTPMTTGKSAAQSGHAAQLALLAMDEGQRGLWASTGWAVRVLTPDAEGWAEAVRQSRIAVHDGGFTEVAPGTQTAVAWW